ncbi:TIGR00730 family Rossman fold protein [Marinobacter daepoensis]|uniref:Cytokinin riboside 5'-monophosphate phosphoribohydrolase n=1 Tax=Marinobacter daepoensis TaxID=262077 RepID=A0ABS3BEJ0_9GAMM|nr:TIGR00730 family Rossman fold protein [Marinobacter daepoensis]MBN7769296.1 TIGR00730 family Rossman fold protein [Marinobacter daepoensis]MBY6032043.1 TIGR00730 family Rossman fold protein [Marinobacter daepoensis]MBY6077986.1 TIGR00730 family Rossman fold protein [Marinobacter daepoensis]
MKIAVFCGSSSGENPAFVEATRALGHYLAGQGVDLVYGGGNVGLMGVIADSFLEKGAKVYGVIPEYLKERELAHQGLTELSIVADMHERKASMANMADAFVALPGGAGTLEEIFEAWTWAQLGHHAKPCAFYNINGFYNLLMEMVLNMVHSGFLKPHHAEMLIHTDNAETLLSSIRSYQAPRQKWT